MMRALSLGLVVLFTLSACGFSARLNPFNWGKSQKTEVIAAEVVTDPRLMVEDVVEMNVETYNAGVIIRARGVTPTQGWWDAELVEIEDKEDAGHLILEFRIFPPVTKTDINTPQSREVTVATTLSPQRLNYITKITVQGANNARTSSTE